MLKQMYVPNWDPSKYTQKNQQIHSPRESWLVPEGCLVFIVKS